MSFDPSAPRPPYVMYEMRAVEDREASIKAGHWVGVDVAFAIITPQGSKDRIERIAADWFKDLEQRVVDKRFPQEWLDAFRRQFASWSRDEEPVLEGSALRNWPVLSPAQYKTLRELRLLTVEDLAAANEETLGRIGMGARALKAKALEWLAQAKGQGTSVEEVTSLRILNERLDEQNTRLSAQNAALAAQLKAVGLNPTEPAPAAT